MAELRNAKAYQRKKQILSLLGLVVTPAILLAMLILPISQYFYEIAQTTFTQNYLQLSLYFLLFSLAFLIFDLPLSFYSGFILEHEYGLSNQTIGGWILTLGKKMVLSFLLSWALLCGLYAMIWNTGDFWWIYAWIGFAFVSYVLGKIFPVFIVPLFYKYGSVESESLKERILKLANRFDLEVERIYSINLSKTTKKANAAFMGMGKSKRVVLSDTLIENFEEEEIETVVAHELGHYKHKDIIRGLAFGIVSSFIAFLIAYYSMSKLTVRYGFDGPGDVAAMPLLFLIFYFFSILTTPLQNAFSRMMERAADRFALAACPNKDVFISCMQKLAAVNLADTNPHPLYEWFFYSHPAISKRIKMAEDLARK